MGRQTAVVATLEDERAFLAFLRATAEVRIFESSAASVEEIEVAEFAPALPYHGQYFIWNTAFPWSPVFGTVDHPKAPAASRGRVFVSNISIAPVLEYDRAVPGLRMAGRVYWSKYFAAPAGLAYDVEEFSRWYDSVVRWIRKFGRKCPFGDREVYLLPDAFRVYGASLGYQRPTLTKSQKAENELTIRFRELILTGREACKAGEFTLAIAKFREAETIRPLDQLSAKFLEMAKRRSVD